MTTYSGYSRGAVCFLALLLLAGCPPSIPVDLDGFIEYQMEKTHIPGLAAMVFDKDGIVWSKGYGWANSEEERPVTDATLFQLASISKLTTATAAMQLVENGQLDLDADINAYLPFQITNPYCPETPITARMLLTHTSSLLDNVNEYEPLYEWGADSPISLRDLLEGFYTPEGKWYHASKCFSKKCPGTEFSYSNLGFALIAYLVEVIANTPFDQYCNAHIFQPLGMNETRWFLRDLNPDHIAMPYRDTSFLWWTSYKPYGQYGYPDYPSGQMRTSVAQYVHFFQAFMNQGALDGQTILQPGTVTQMMTLQNPGLAPNQCLGWIALQQDDGTTIYGHGGGEHGVLTMAWFRPQDGRGVFIFTNGDVNDLLIWRDMNRVKAIEAIQARMFEETFAAS